MKKQLALILTVLSSYAYSDAQSEALAAGEPPPITTPWLTGPLLTPSAVAVPKGSYEIEPYLFYTIFTGFYNEHWKAESIPSFYQTNLQVVGWIGITKNADISLIVQGFYNSTEGVSDSGIGDPSLTLDWQLFSENQSSLWIPSIKLSVAETFPVGKYQHLSPHKKLTDGIGQGTFITTFALTFSKIYPFGGDRYLSSILSFSNGISTPVSIKGLSVYQGDKTTKGTIYPGNVTKILYGTEYSLTKHWVLALDIGAFFYAKTRFSGHTKSLAGFPSSTQITLSPAIEYNWSATLGAIFGVWFTVAGRNDYQFVSPATAVSIYGVF